MKYVFVARCIIECLVVISSCPLLHIFNPHLCYAENDGLFPCVSSVNKSNCWPKTNQLQPFYKLAGHLAVNLIFWNLLLKKGYNESQHLSHNPFDITPYITHILYCGVQCAVQVPWEVDFNLSNECFTSDCTTTPPCSRFMPSFYLSTPYPTLPPIRIIGKYL